MERYSVGEVVEQAVQTERLGYDYYMTMAARFRDTGGLKDLFETLAAKEKAHEKMFADLKQVVRDDTPEGWEEVSYYLRAIVESEFFLGTGKSLSELGHVKTAADALRFALGFEKETLLYYLALRDAVREKQLVDRIIDEEKTHIVWLSRFIKELGA